MVVHDPGGRAELEQARPEWTILVPLALLSLGAIVAGQIFHEHFVGAEQGATSLFSGMYVHEFLHDGRHLLGFPCH